LQWSSLRILLPGSQCTDDESNSADAQTDTSDEAESQKASDSSRTYTVKKGDCLWNIAASELGDGSRWQEIYELNQGKIDNPSLIYTGQEFVLPAA
jgi:2',3'-cyclic-nucleotide 2'-phosphodiesterase/3'-nucleotidase